VRAGGGAGCDGGGGGGGGNWVGRGPAAVKCCSSPCTPGNTRTPPNAGGADGSPAKEWWGLAEVVDVLRRRYCGTLALEYKHLFQQDEISWVERRFETRAPLAAAEKAAVLRQLLEVRRGWLAGWLAGWLIGSLLFGLLASCWC
jgi:hypothetical protein